MRSVAEECGDIVASLLEPYSGESDEAGRRCFFAIPFDPAKDTDVLFELRIKLTLSGIYREVFHLADLGRSYPSRFIRLLAAQATAQLMRQEDTRSIHDDIWSEPDRVERDKLRVYRAVGKALPALAIDELLPVALRTIETKPTPLSFRRYGHSAIPVPVAHCLIGALGAELRINPDTYFRRIESEIRIADDNPLTKILLCSMLMAPTLSADRIVDWVIAHPDSLRNYDRNESTEWELARRVIHRISRRCSDQAYHRLEQFLLRYRDEQEFASIKSRHEWFREQMEIPNRVGQTQYHLLPALPAFRKSPEATGLEGVLKRKFCAYHESFFQSHFIRGGHVGSPIDGDKLQQLSDRTWLRIIRDNREAPRSRPRYRGNYFTESSPRQFSADLSLAVRCDPQRFARLAHSIPEDANPIYFDAVLAGLTTKSPPSHLSPEQHVSWKPIEGDELFPLVNRALRSSDIPNLSTLLRLLREWPTLSWPEELVVRIISLALRDETDSARILSTSGVEPQIPPVQDLETRAINCPRGEAAEAIKAMLWHDLRWLPILRFGIERLVEDDDPAVRVAAVACCGPVWNYERDLASHWYFKACNHRDDRVMACHAANYLMRFVALTLPEAAICMVKRMIASDHPEVAQCGAAHSVAFWLSKGWMADDVVLCRTGNPPQRRGVAIAAADLARENHTEAAIALLIPLLDDDDRDVLRHCNRVFHSGEVLDRPELREFMERYSRSKCFLSYQWPLVHVLEGYTRSLLPAAGVLMAIVATCAGPLRDASRDASTGTMHTASQLGPLILRLYEQAEGAGDEAVRQYCLDAWDLLLERGVGVVRELIDAIDQ